MHLLQVPPNQARFRAHSTDEGSTTNEYSTPTFNRARAQTDSKVEQLVAAFAASGVPLNSPWTLYIDKTPTAGSSLNDYTQNLKKVYTFKTIEEFWQVYNNIPVPKKLENMYSFHLMRGVERRPVWEDANNENGGYWKLKCNKKFSNQVWKEILLATVGEQFEDDIAKDSQGQAIDQVVGVTVSVREVSDHFQIWNENYKGAESATIVEKITKDLLPKVKFHSIYYKEHKEHDDFECKQYLPTNCIKSKTNFSKTPTVTGSNSALKRCKNPFFRPKYKSFDPAEVKPKMG